VRVAHLYTSLPAIVQLPQQGNFVLIASSHWRSDTVVHQVLRLV
jgi:hypothetical protein